MLSIEDLDAQAMPVKASGDVPKPKFPTVEDVAEKAAVAMKALQQGADEVAAMRAMVRSFAEGLDALGEGIETDFRNRAQSFTSAVEAFGRLANDTVSALQKEREKLDNLGR